VASVPRGAPDPFGCGPEVVVDQSGRTDPSSLRPGRAPGSAAPPSGPRRHPATRKGRCGAGRAPGTSDGRSPSRLHSSRPIASSSPPRPDHLEEPGARPGEPRHRWQTRPGLPRLVGQCLELVPTTAGVRHDGSSVDSRSTTARPRPPDNQPAIAGEAVVSEPRRSSVGGRRFNPRRRGPRGRRVPGRRGRGTLVPKAPARRLAALHLQVSLLLVFQLLPPAAASTLKEVGVGGEDAGIGGAGSGCQHPYHQHRTRHNGP
jgi:hypothetical protein